MERTDNGASFEDVASISLIGIANVRPCDGIDTPLADVLVPLLNTIAVRRVVAFGERERRPDVDSALTVRLAPLLPLGVVASLLADAARRRVDDSAPVSLPNDTNDDDVLIERLVAPFGTLSIWRRGTMDDAPVTLDVDVDVVDGG
jgi:hypothetical protein